jgi:hypothetical protein
MHLRMLPPGGYCVEGGPCGACGRGLPVCCPPPHPAECCTTALGNKCTAFSVWGRTVVAATEPRTTLVGPVHPRVGGKRCQAPAPFSHPHTPRPRWLLPGVQAARRIKRTRDVLWCAHAAGAGRGLLVAAGLGAGCRVTVPCGGVCTGVPLVAVLRPCPHPRRLSSMHRSTGLSSAQPNARRYYAS